MKKAGMIILLLLVYRGSFGQVAPQKYFVEFMDKANSQYSLDRPEEFLTARAIERRAKQGIIIVENDIPVNQNYINAVRSQGADILTRSKWFNGVTVYCLNPSIIDSIRNLPFVKHVYKNIIKNSVNNYIPVNKHNLIEVFSKSTNLFTIPSGPVAGDQPAFDYGPSFTQIHMLNGDSLHRMGYRGDGMVIAVLDAGFYNADTLRAFDSLRANNQILGTKDFVKPGNNVYHEYEHGMEVLSCMGGYLPGELIGTAPKAKFWLLRTEDYSSEYLIEEYNWVSAAEFADSAGADIINSSLGYTVFNNPLMNHDCGDMDGNTTPATRGANLAFSKGMVVVNSAGNEGGSAWNCVSAPSDGFSVLSIAAVDSNGLRASFSSTGEATRRIKPNVAAMGRAVVVSSTVGLIMHSSGTSFSSPILAGLVACLWQAAPVWKNTDIMRAVEISGSQAGSPDSLVGYGIPDFVKALQKMSAVERTAVPEASVYPNPFYDQFTLKVGVPATQEIILALADLSGKCLYKVTRDARAGENRIRLTCFSGLATGTYILKITGRDIVATLKIVKTGQH